MFLAGRTASTLDEVADAIRSVGRAANTAGVDALDAAAFAASDWARSVTGAIVNVSAGALID